MKLYHLFVLLWFRYPCLLSMNSIYWFDFPTKNLNFLASSKERGQKYFINKNNWGHIPFPGLERWQSASHSSKLGNIYITTVMWTRLKIFQPINRANLSERKSISLTKRILQGNSVEELGADMDGRVSLAELRYSDLMDYTEITNRFSLTDQDDLWLCNSSFLCFIHYNIKYCSS